MKIPPCLFVLPAALLLAGTFGVAACAQTVGYSVQHSFAALTSDGANPAGVLVQGENGNFYGTTAAGGANGYGTVFQVTPSGACTTLHNFSGSDGISPTGLVADEHGTTFYGTATVGGPAKSGVVFSITENGTFTVLHNFSGYNQGGDDGANPTAALVRDGGSFFVGTTEFGGVNNRGCIYTIDSKGNYTNLHSFSALDGNNTDGANPTCQLAIGFRGRLYGTASRGGVNGAGTVYAVSVPDGSTFTIVHSFTNTNSDGAYPDNGLVTTPDLNTLYGTTAFGGSHGQGVIYNITSGENFGTVYNFNGASGVGTKPTGTLIEDSQGNFFGTTSAGGVNGNGTVFELSFVDRGGFHRPFVSTFFNFPAEDDHHANRYGVKPLGGLILGSDGSFYGTASEGGAGGAGAVFAFTSAGVPTALHGFSDTNSDGAVPRPTLVRGNDGSFYGTTSGGAVNGHGSAFKITSAGAVSVLHSFVYASGDVPLAGLIQGSDGNFYGTADDGGANGSGVVFQIKPGGAYTVLYSFGALTGEANSDGAYPQAALVEGSDGAYYGSTMKGGANGVGTVFKITSDGTLTTLHTLSSNDDGAYPVAELIDGGGGSFYGTTSAGGQHLTGTLFKITPDGTFTTLHNFDPTGVNRSNSDGANPQAALVKGSSGNFYGTAKFGGSGGTGTVFQLTPAGLFTTLHSFGALDGNMANGDGAQPLGALVEGSDGNLYGTTSAGGSDASATGYGTVFRMTLAGAVTTLHNFTVSNGDGVYPAAGLAEGTEGTFYGTTTAGGSNGTGAVFQVILAPVVTSAASATASEGQDFHYQIMATNTPTGYGVLGLPPGLKVDAKTGLISGKPTVHGVRMLTLTASNGGGKGTEVLTLNIAETVPVITSATTANGTQGSPFEYHILATNHPTHYGVLGLPPGFKVDASTGLVFGTPTFSGTRMLTLQATNTAGTGKQTLTLVIAGAPVITSAMKANATVGKVFTYQITATNNPTSYGVVGLPPGLKVDGKTGIISGTPTAAGMKSLMLNASNSAGKGSATLSLTITN